MRRHFSLLLVAGVVVAGLLFTLRAQERVTDKPVRRWEHMAMTHHGANVGTDPQLARQINRVGEEGWELVSAINTQETGKTKNTILFFKRPK